MYEILALIMKYILTFTVYYFIFNIAKLIYQDIKTITVGEDAKTLVPHLKLMSTLTGTKTEAVSEIFPLLQIKTNIGRSSSCHIVLPNQHVSSIHALINFENDNFYITDQKSANGTYINNQLIVEKVKLKTNDRIGIGNVILLFSEGGK